MKAGSTIPNARERATVRLWRTDEAIAVSTFASEGSRPLQAAQLANSLRPRRTNIRSLFSVSKTVVRLCVPWVRIPPPPPISMG